jgi:hypothetical protein
VLLLEEWVEEQNADHDPTRSCCCELLLQNYKKQSQLPMANYSIALVDVEEEKAACMQQQHHKNENENKKNKPLVVAKKLSLLDSDSSSNCDHEL